MQLESLRAFVECEGRRGRPETAAQLRCCIADHLHADVRLKAAVDAVLLCAYGAAPHKARAQLPPRSAVVEVAVRENAFNKLGEDRRFERRDETVFVAFHQHIRMQGSGHTEVFDAKHESQLMYEGETLSYDPAVYGGAFEARARIKTLKVYNHHCIDGLPAKARALRDAAVYGLRQREALAWALELLGFRDVCVKVQAGQLPLSEAVRSAAADDKLLEHFCAAQPVLCNVRYSVCMSL